MSPKKRAAKPPAGLPADVDSALSDLLDSLQNRTQAAQPSPGAPEANPAADELREAARRLLRAADALESATPGALRPFKRSGKVSGMTAAQKADRAQAISQARARTSGDRFATDVSKSEWKSMNRYAKERLRCSPGQLSNYRQGIYGVPEHIQDMVLSDFGYRIGKPVKPRAKRD